MNSLILAFRSRSLAFLPPTQSSLSLSIRGPKKKKGPVKSDVPDSSDIVNIFKDRPDPQIHTTDRYPPFVTRLLQETFTPEDTLI